MAYLLMPLPRAATPTLHFEIFLLSCQHQPLEALAASCYSSSHIFKSRALFHATSCASYRQYWCISYNLRPLTRSILCNTSALRTQTFFQHNKLPWNSGKNIFIAETSLWTRIKFLSWTQCTFKATSTAHKGALQTLRRNLELT